jgi:plastocyanin
MKRIVVAIATLAMVAAAGQAGAANYNVFLGEQVPCGFIRCPGAPPNIPKGATLNSFLPKKVTIVEGDSVTFSSATFHTVTFAPKEPPLFVPDPAKGKYNGFLDSANEPFYFNGRPKMIYNGAAFAPYGPKTISGSTPTSSGALSPNGPKAKPATFTYTFPKAGTYKFFCTVHPGMKGTIVVKPAGSTAPLTPAQVSAQALNEVTDGWNKAKELFAASKPPAATVETGVGGAVTLLANLPKTLRIKAGTTVTFVNKAPTEAHNVVFGPKKYIEALQKKTDLFPTGPAGPNQVAPVLLLGSEPEGHYSYDGRNHGNGFLSTPVTDGLTSGPLPHSWKVTFTKPGTYKYFCWIHGPDMGGTIIVTP